MPPDLNFDIPSFTDIPDPEKQGESDYNQWVNKLFEKAQNLLDESVNNNSNWSKPKKYNGIDVNVCKNNPLGGNMYWAARHSEHKNKSYNEFKMGLYDNHAKNEAEYIPIIKHANLIQLFKDGEVQVWSIAYKMPVLVTDRVFNMVILKREFPAQENGGKSKFINISIPIKLSPQELPEYVEQREQVIDTLKTHVAGYYIAVEQVAETESGTIKWDMATSSKAGGNIPDFITNMSLASTITHDVEAFLNWLKENK